MKEKIKKKEFKLIMLLSIFLIILINSISFARFEYIKEIEIASIEIKKEKPKIKLVSAKSDNIIFPNYVNRYNKIYIEILTVGIIKEDYLSRENIEIIVGNKKIEKESIKVEKYKENNYRIILSEIKNEGKLKIIIPSKIFVNEYDLKNDKCVFETQITVDNTSPIVSQIKEEINDDLVKVFIKTNEQILEPKGWNKTENPRIIYKEIEKEEKILMHIRDYAGNKNTIEIKT